MKTMVKASILFLMMVLPSLAGAQKGITSTKYVWEEPRNEVAPGIHSTVLFEGQAYDFDFLQMNATTIAGYTPARSFKVPAHEEHLILLKDGLLTISFSDSTWTIGKGSVALLMPEMSYSLQNKSNEKCSFYVMKYQSKTKPDSERGGNHGGSIVKDWKKIPFHPHGRGGIRNYFDRPTAMAKRLEMHVTTLKEGIKSHEPHTHRAEELVIILDNDTEMQIGEEFFRGNAGTIYFLGSNVPHAIQNIGTTPCVYFAFQFE
ncbi:MAG TPA: cupin domain-containing protein [Ohtaekwangia sp.]|nr:cupin domain-containing protein [Ohtaekwangia sp.]